MTDRPESSPDDVPAVDERTLDELAFDAWPAETVQTIGPWRARFTQGMTRRANSVLPFGGASRSAGDISDWLDEVQRAYQSRGLRPRFQVAKTATPADLDRQLALSGYVIEAPVHLMVRRSVPSQVTPSRELFSAVSGARQTEWFALATSGRFGNFVTLYAELLDRIGTRARYAEVSDVTGRVIATGLGVDGAAGWMGIFGMYTVPNARRKGAGRTLLEAMVSDAQRRGIRQLYLQVERDNAPAISLYRASGFESVYDYHYRSAPHRSL